LQATTQGIVNGDLVEFDITVFNPAIATLNERLHASTLTIALILIRG
jgi:hypothetical protein